MSNVMRQHYVMVGGTAVLWNHGNVQTCLSCVQVSSESVWTPVWLLMSKQQKLFKFKWCMIVGTRQMKQSISEIVSTFNIPQSMLSCVYWEYLMTDITHLLGQHSSQICVLNDLDQKHLARIVHGSRQVIVLNHIHMQEVPDIYPSAKFIVI